MNHPKLQRPPPVEDKTLHLWLEFLTDRIDALSDRMYGVSESLVRVKILWPATWVLGGLIVSLLAAILTERLVE